MERPVKKGAPLLMALKILLLMYVITGILLLALTAALSRLQLQEGAVSVAVVAIYLISGFVGGLAAGKKRKSRKFLWGMMMGGCYFVVLAIGSILFHRGLDMDMMRLATTLALCVASGMAGGMVG